MFEQRLDAPGQVCKDLVTAYYKQNPVAENFGIPLRMYEGFLLGRTIAWWDPAKGAYEIRTPKKEEG